MQKDLVKTIWLCTISIIIIGLISLYSATYQNTRVTSQVFYDQLFFAIVGLILMYYLGKIDYRKFFDAAYALYAINVVLLLFVLLLGRHALGARRWIELGPLSFQPSELTKLSIILLFGRYFSEYKSDRIFYFAGKMGRLAGELIAPLILTMIPVLLIFKQPDLGTAILIFGIFYVMLFISKIGKKVFLSFTAFCLICVPFAWHILKPYQKDRLLVFLNPNIDPLGAGYTIIQSKIAIGSGTLFGRGWLAGTQNQLNFLPERHTDFIFSVVGEEWGLLGALVLLSCYFILINCALQIAEQVKDDFGVFVTMGIVSILTLQVTINIGMVMGLCPVVGLTLPLVSYGRTSFLIFIVMMGFLCNLSQKRTVF
jgi:rod shape determining protein RodA